MTNFDFVTPTTVSEAIDMLIQSNGNGYVIAGGTDLIVDIKSETISPQLLISLKRISGLSDIKLDQNGALIIGATATLSDIADSPIVNKFQKSITSAVITVGSQQIRNRGTIGGNICHASPAADTVPILLTLNAVVGVSGPDGARTVPLDKFLIKPGHVNLNEGELVTHIAVPAASAGLRSCYLKHGLRNAMEISVASVGVALSKTGNYCQTIKVALGSVAPTPMLVQGAERCVLGKDLSATLDEIADVAAEECSPISDIRASAEYRREMVKVLTKRALVNLDF